MNGRTGRARWSAGRRWLAAFVLGCLLASPGAAADVALRVTVEKNTVELGEPFDFVITVESAGGQVGSPPSPNFDGFVTVPSGTSTSINMTNGEVRVLATSTYSLIPQRLGTFTLGPVSLQTGGATVQSDTVTVQVVAAGQGQPGASAPPAARPGGPAPPAPGESPSPQGRLNPDKLFLYADVSKRESLVGEPLSYYSALLSEYDLGECAIESEAQFTGFVVESMEAKRQLRPVTFRGKNYPLGCEISKKILIPAAPGTFTIQPEVLRTGVKLRVAPHQRGRGGWPFQSDDPFQDPLFDQFFGRNYQLRRESIRGTPIQVKVMPLPDSGKPANFSGIIAESLSISSGLDRKVESGKASSVSESDALNFRVVFTGRGDIRGISKPELALGDSFKEYESKATPEVKVDENGISGKKTFEYVLVPRKSGQLVIPAVEVSYFDSGARAYRTLRSEPIALEIKPGEKEERLSSGAAGSAQKEFTVLGQDVRFISESPSALEDAGPPLHDRTWFQLVNGLALAAFLVFAAATRRRKFLAGNPALARRLAAGRLARDTLDETRKLLRDRPVQELHGRLEDLLLQYLWNKLGVAANSLVLESCDALLAERGVAPALAIRLKEMLLGFQASRYAPGQGNRASLETDLEMAEGMLDELERAL
jgi:hypothetical protein